MEVTANICLQHILATVISVYSKKDARMNVYGHQPPFGEEPKKEKFATVEDSSRSDGSTASYYQLPTQSTELQHLISFKNMNAQIGEIFRSCYRYGESSHSNQLRDAKKIKFYIDAEIERLSGDY